MRDLWKDPWKNDDAAAMTRRGGRITWGREGRCRGVVANPNPNQAFSRVGFFPSFLPRLQAYVRLQRRMQSGSRPPATPSHVTKPRGETPKQNFVLEESRGSRNIFLACSLLFTRRRRDPPPTCFAAPWLPRAVRHCCSFYVQAWRKKSGCYCCCDWQSLKGAAKDVETATPPKKAATPPHGCCG